MKDWVINMDLIKKQLDCTLNEVKFNLEGEYYRGKVRDNYFSEDTITMITSDRVSAFDRVLGTIPFKGQILTEIAKFWFDKTKHIVPNHIISHPDPQVLITKRAKTLPVEVIVRQYITGSLWREYKSGKNGQYGFMLPDNLKENQKFDSLILTPTTKAEYGMHDEPISRDEIIDNLVDKDIYEKVEKYALELFKAGQDWASKRGLILVDTKYEFGIYKDEIIIIDEIHTPDSSRFWVADQYDQLFAKGEKQKMLDKENIRQWLLDKGFSGDGTPPPLDDEIRILLSSKYIELYEKLTNQKFVPSVGDVKNRIEGNLMKINV